MHAIHRRWLLILLCLVAAAGPLKSPATAAERNCLDDPEARVTIGGGGRAAVRPGGGGQLVLSCERCCWVPENADAKVKWSLEPASAGTVKADGHFTLRADLAPGTRIKAIGEVASGAHRRVEMEIVVIDPAPQPWAGLWREAERLPCAGAKPAAAGADVPLIREFELSEDGTFAVTWHPFERYKDYWGTYTVDRKTNAIRFTVTVATSCPRGSTSPARSRFPPPARWFSKTSTSVPRATRRASPPPAATASAVSETRTSRPAYGRTPSSTRFTAVALCMM